MTPNFFLRLLADRPYLVADGAIGTGLFQRGLETGLAPELWNETHPGQVEDLHQEYVDAGSDIILTNSFGCTVYRLKLHGSEGRVRALSISEHPGARAGGGRGQLWSRADGERSVPAGDARGDVG